MDLTVGAIVEGKVKTITKFGAFIALPDNKTGMVHISEVAHTYVNDIHDYLTEGQDVQVKIMEIDPAGKINLSIKKTQEAPARTQQRAPRPAASPAPQNNSRRSGSAPGGSPASKEPASFDEMLKQFMADSDNKISSIRQYSEHRSKTRRR
ncbi:MAG: S1 RNA-binding domain-containing protein [Oscillospiraceae bacterium]|nr:S1 RNA-binding domain-containing protein [Oscillospiraceae bacterium]